MQAVPNMQESVLIIIIIIVHNMQERLFLSLSSDHIDSSTLHDKDQGMWTQTLFVS